MTIFIFYLNCFAFQKFIIFFFCILFTSFYGALLSLLYSFVQISLSFLDPWQQSEGSCKIGSARLSVLPSVPMCFRLAVCLGVFLEFFLNFGMVLESHVELCMTARFSGKNFFASKLGKWAKNCFFQFIGKFGHQFLLNLIYNETLQYLLCSCPNPIIWKIFVPEIWAKMFSANKIEGFIIQSYLQNKSMIQPDFLHIDTISKLTKKSWGGRGHRTLKLTLSQE